MHTLSVAKRYALFIVVLEAKEHAFAPPLLRLFGNFWRRRSGVVRTIACGRWQPCLLCFLELICANHENVCRVRMGTKLGGVRGPNRVVTCHFGTWQKNLDQRSCTTRMCTEKVTNMPQIATPKPKSGLQRGLRRSQLGMSDSADVRRLLGSHAVL